MTDDRFDNFPLMADKIRVRSTDEGFAVQSNEEAINACMVFCGAMESNKNWGTLQTGYLVGTQGISCEKCGYH